MRGGKASGCCGGCRQRKSRERKQRLRLVGIIKGRGKEREPAANGEWVEIRKDEVVSKDATVTIKQFLGDCSTQRSAVEPWNPELLQRSGSASTVRRGLCLYAR
jgi:hypothetical protein